MPLNPGIAGALLRFVSLEIKVQHACGKRKVSTSSVNTLIEDLQNDGVSITQQVAAIFAGTVALVQATIPIRNVISSVLGTQTDLDIAITGTYYRMSLLMESLTRLNEPQDFQVAAHCTRCLYESHLDIVELLGNPTHVPKFMAFPFVARFAAADKLVRELSSQGVSDPSIHCPERQFVADPANVARFATDCTTHWPNKTGLPKAPMSWSGLDLAARARVLGPQELLRYRQLYSLLSWYSHSGIVGVANVSSDGLEAAMGMAHGNAQKFFSESTNHVASHFQIYTAQPAFRVPVDQYQAATVMVMEQFLRKAQDAKS